MRVTVEQLGSQIELKMPALAVGGEAAVHEVLDREGVLAKVLTQPTGEHEAKVRAMTRHALARRQEAAEGAPEHPLFAWPYSALRNKRGQYCGLLMPRIERAYELHVAYDPDSRKQSMPHFTARHRLFAARQIARAVGALHQHGVLVGDLSSRNILVHPDDGSITLIDADSFQLRDESGRLYRCTVGTPEYLAPELHGQDLTTFERQTAQDNFALGVILFKLLTEGFHPFLGMYLGWSGRPPDLLERIRQGWWPYHPRCRKFAPPQDCRAAASLPLASVELFARCFAAGHGDPGARPRAEEWEAVLTGALDGFVICRACPEHAYDVRWAQCPRCVTLLPPPLALLQRPWLAWLPPTWRGLRRIGGRCWLVLKPQLAFAFEQTCLWATYKIGQMAERCLRALVVIAFVLLLVYGLPVLLRILGVLFSVPIRAGGS